MGARQSDAGRRVGAGRYHIPRSKNVFTGEVLDIPHGCAAYISVISRAPVISSKWNACPVAHRLKRNSLPPHLSHSTPLHPLQKNQSVSSNRRPTSRRRSGGRAWTSPSERGRAREGGEGSAFLPLGASWPVGLRAGRRVPCCRPPPSSVPEGGRGPRQVGGVGQEGTAHQCYHHAIITLFTVIITLS